MIAKEALRTYEYFRQRAEYGPRRPVKMNGLGPQAESQIGAALVARNPNGSWSCQTSFSSSRSSFPVFESSSDCLHVERSLSLGQAHTTAKVALAVGATGYRISNAS
jgi:hypothetical protein